MTGAVEHPDTLQAAWALIDQQHAVIASLQWRIGELERQATVAGHPA